MIKTLLLLSMLVSVSANAGLINKIKGSWASTKMNETDSMQVLNFTKVTSFTKQIESLPSCDEVVENENTKFESAVVFMKVAKNSISLINSRTQTTDGVTTVCAGDAEVLEFTQIDELNSNITLLSKEVLHFEYTAKKGKAPAKLALEFL